jgi:prepilin-type N-terminal cleavage/methylation domain-containing protein
MQTMETMKKQKQNTDHGFTLLELMVSMALGLTVMAAMASLFKTGMNSTFLVAQRAETQQNMRTSIDLLTKDISLAGSGIPSGGIQLPLGNGATPARFGCDQGGTCYVPTHTYPNNNYMYGVVPGWSNGVQGNAVVPASVGRRNDSITVIYADYNFPLWEYDVTFPVGAASGTLINLAPDAAFAPAPPAVNAAGGIQVGDLILLNGTNGNTAVGEVTGLTANSITFADLDPLNINYSGKTHTNNVYAVGGGVGQAAGTQATAYRLFAVTYYLTVPAAGQLPRLMRQVNGLTPVPVADNIINLQFAYDIYNSNVNPATLDANQPNPLGVAENPNLMQKVNLLVMGQSMTSDGNKSQSMYLATGVSARNMSFRDRYK